MTYNHIIYLNFEQRTADVLGYIGLGHEYDFLRI